jgi:hypothetical protein
MEEILLKYNVIQSLGYVNCKVPQDVFKTVEEEVSEIIKTNFEYATKYNASLAGAIEHEYRLHKCEYILNKFFKQVIPEYWRLNNDFKKAKQQYQIYRNKSMLSKPDLWCNIQKKYEYNPVHNHAGDLSFVLYIKIPYDLKEEAEQPHIKNNSDKVLPSFTFLCPSIGNVINAAGQRLLVESYTLTLNRSHEGMMLIFPAWLQHMVSPFYTSDDYRISVSGNLTLVDNG